ncbi:MAG: hypothetical protein U1U88_001835 [Lawsonella clevelandensis]
MFRVVLVMAAMASLDTPSSPISPWTPRPANLSSPGSSTLDSALAGLSCQQVQSATDSAAKALYRRPHRLYHRLSYPIWWDTANALIAARAVWPGAAFVMSSTLSILASRVPSRRRPLAIAIWGASAGIGAVLGLA